MRRPAPMVLMSTRRARSLTFVVLASLSGACLTPAVRPVFDADHSTVTVTPTTGVLADGHAEATIKVTLLSSSGAPVAGVPVLLAASGSRNFFIQPAVSDAHGIATGSLTSTAAEMKVITASVGGVAIPMMPSVQFVAGTQTQLVFLTQPASVAAGALMTMPVQVALEDADGNVAPVAAPVRLTLLNGPVGAMLGGTPTVTTLAGVASFPDLNITTTGTGYRLQANMEGLPSVNSMPFDVIPAAEAKLIFAVEPSNVVAGARMTPGVEILIEDQFGNIVSGSADAVTLSVATGPASAALSGTTTRNAASGQATFGDLSIATAGSGFTLKASAAGLEATSTPFVVSAGARSQLAFVVQPSAARAGTAIAPPVQVAFEDAFGNVVDTSDDVTVALASGPSGATLAGAATVSAAAGIGSFGALVLNRPGTYTLSATAGALTGTSTPFVVSSGPPSRVVFVVQPSNATAGAAIAPPVQVALEDALGNLIPDSTTAVSVAIGTHAAAGSLAGTSTQTATAGIAAFDNLSINTAGAGYTLTATASAYAGGTSLPFDIFAGAPANGTCTVTAVPPSVAADGTSQTQITVTALDSQGNIVSGAPVSLSVSGTANMLGLTSGMTNVNGIFATSLASTKAETKLITATIGSTATASASVQFTPGGPSRTGSSLTTMPAIVPVDTGVGNILVTVADTEGNPIAGVAVQLSVTGSGNTLSPSLANSGQDGTVSATLLSTTAEQKTVTAVVDSFALTGTFTFIGVAPSITTSMVSATPGSVTADGVSTAQVLVTVEDVHGNVVPQQAVTLTVSGSGNDLSSTGGPTDQNGQFAATLASTTAEMKTISANVGAGNVMAAVTFTACPDNDCQLYGYSSGMYCDMSTAYTCGTRGICNLATASTLCANGCTNGVCNPLCTSNFCQDNNYVSGSYCSDASTLDTCGSSGGCAVVSAMQTCPNGCSGGACTPCPSNLCQDNGESSGNYCSHSTQYSCGTSGACDVVESSMNCPNGCANGACVPCPSNSCQDNGHSSGNYCNGSTQYSCGTSGACDIVTASTVCPNGCSGGACTPCPSNYCQDNGHSSGSYCSGTSIISCGTSGACNVVTGASTCNASCSNGSCYCGNGNGLYCAGNGVTGNTGTLYQCTNGGVSVAAVCGVSCVFEPPGTNDKCATTCPSGNGYYCGNDEINGSANTLYNCVNGNITAIQNCANGCIHEPPGINDKCG